MTATERLRELLDERVVEYDVRDGKAIKNTYWDDDNGRRWGYTSDESGVIKDRQLFLVRGRLDITPEQAVEATVGRGTCRLEPHATKIGGEICHTFECDTCKSTVATPFIDYYPPSLFFKYCPFCGREVVS